MLQTIGQVTPVATNERPYPSIALVAQYNVVTFLMVYILTSFAEDFKWLGSV